MTMSWSAVQSLEVGASGGTVCWHGMGEKWHRIGQRWRSKAGETIKWRSKKMADPACTPIE